MTIIIQQIEKSLNSVLEVLTKLKWDDVPEDVRYKAVLIFADDLSAIMAASHESELQLFWN